MRTACGKLIQPDISARATLLPCRNPFSPDNLPLLELQTYFISLVIIFNKGKTMAQVLMQVKY